jgi:KaiC/GvpD/RAD55 family RecA-like ATPase
VPPRRQASTNRSRSKSPPGVIELAVDRRHEEWQRSLRVTKMRGTALEPTEMRVRMVSGTGLE